MRGALVLEQTTDATEQRLDLSHLAGGVYVLHIQHGLGVVTRRVVLHPH